MTLLTAIFLLREGRRSAFPLFPRIPYFP
jgi:hypothetical protein